jgi:type II secretory pathway predicted ATPase ExeA
MSMGSTLDIYTTHFGLRERPFSLVPDPEFLYWAAPHRRAFAMLEYGLVSRAPITVITGEVGAGKTTLLYHLLGALGPEVRVGLIANAHGDRGELLRWVLLALAQPTAPGATYVDLFGQFQNFLIAEYAAGRRVVLIFDEAQNLSRESLEELRMLTNINSGKDELLQLVLVGQPELRDTIRRPDLVQFAQRVTSSFHLPAMDAEMVRGYIRHRLAVAGAPRPIFDEAAMNRVHAATRGVPRLVNQLCDMAMVYAYAKEETAIGAETIEQVIADGVFFAGGGDPGAAEPAAQPATQPAIQPAIQPAANGGPDARRATGTAG